MDAESSPAVVETQHLHQLQELDVLHLGATQGRTDIIKAVVEMVKESSSGDALPDAHLDEEEKVLVAARCRRLKGVNLKEFLSAPKNGLTALHLAVEHGHADILRVLLQEGASPQVKSSALSSEGLSCYQLAEKREDLKQVFVQELFQLIPCGEVERVQGLVAAGLDPWDPSIVDGSRLQEKPLHWAAGFGQDQIVAFLCERDNSNINCLNSEGATPLHEAAKAGHKSTVEMLLSLGASPAIKGTDGYSRQKTPRQVAKDELTRSCFPEDELIDSCPFVDDAFPLIWPPAFSARCLKDVRVMIHSNPTLQAPGGPDNQLAVELLKTSLFSRGVSTNAAAIDAHPRDSEVIAANTEANAEFNHFVISMVVDCNVCTREQEYRLTIMPAQLGGIQLRAHDPPSLFYGAQTFCQLIEFYSSGVGSELVLPACVVVDFPLIAVRATEYHLSMGRLPTEEYARVLVQNWAKARINQVHLSFEGCTLHAEATAPSSSGKKADEADTISALEIPTPLHRRNSYRQSPLEPEGLSATGFSLKRFDSYCKRYHIQVIPRLEVRRPADIVDIPQCFNENRKASINIHPNGALSPADMLKNCQSESVDSIFLSASLAALNPEVCVQLLLHTHACISLIQDLDETSDLTHSQNYFIPTSYLRFGRFAPLGLGLALRGAVFSLWTLAKTATHERLSFLMAPLHKENFFFPPTFIELLDFIGGGLAWNHSKLPSPDLNADKYCQYVQEIVQKHQFTQVEQSHHQAAVSFISNLLFRNTSSEDTTPFMLPGEIQESFAALDALLWGLHTQDFEVFQKYKNGLPTAQLKQRYKSYAKALSSMPPGMTTLVNQLRLDHRGRPHDANKKKAQPKPSFRAPAIELGLGKRLMEEIPLGIELLKSSALTLCRAVSAMSPPKTPKKTKAVGDASVSCSDSFQEFVVRIPTGARSDLANELLDLYEALIIHFMKIFIDKPLKQNLQQCYKIIRILSPNSVTKNIDFDLAFLS